MAIVWGNSRLRACRGETRSQGLRAITAAQGRGCRRKRSGRTGGSGVFGRSRARTAALTRARARQPRPLPSTARRLAVTLALRHGKQ
eukprot:4355569-Prymnesium_polylepis.3